MKNHEGLSDKEIIRRLKDRNVYLEKQNKSHFESNQKMMLVDNQLFKFMNDNDLWELFHKQKRDLYNK
jgi:hypothetical protein